MDLPRKARLVLWRRALFQESLPPLTQARSEEAPQATQSPASLWPQRLSPAARSSGSGSPPLSEESQIAPVGRANLTPGGGLPGLGTGFLGEGGGVIRSVLRFDSILARIRAYDGIGFEHGER